MWNGRVVLEDRVYGDKGSAETLRFEELPVARRVHVREVEHRTYPVGAPRDLDDIVDRTEIAHTPHDLDAERDSSAFAFQSLAQRGELFDHRVDCVLTTPAEKKARVEDDELCAARCRDSRAAVEGADRRGELSPACFEMAHEAEQRRMHREREIVLSSKLAETLGERVVHPEPTLEVDLAG